MHKFYNPEAREWTGPPLPSLFNPETGVGQVLFYALTQNAPKVVQIFADDDSRLTCGDLKLRSSRVALNLLRLGLKQGDRVCFVSSNNKDVASILIGCVFLGVVFNGVEISLPREVVAHKFRMIRPRLVICETFKEEMVLEALREAGLETPVMTFGPSGTDSLFERAENEQTFTPLPISDSSRHPLMVANTSGTTGMPKGVLVSHAACISMGLSLSQVPQSGEVLLSFTPMSWITTPTLMFRCILTGAAFIMTSRPFTPEYQTSLIQRYGVNILFSFTFTATHFVSYLREKDVYLESVRTFITGGTFVHDELKRGISKYLPKCTILNIYGMSEAYVISADFLHRKSGSVGFPAERMKIKITNEKNERLGPNESGEVCIKPPTPFLGYLSDQSKVVGMTDSEGFFHTGDIGHLDDSSLLFLEGRMKDLIRCRNAQGVYSTLVVAGSIEEVIARETGLVQVCVVGIDDPELGYEAPAAAVVRPREPSWTPEEIEKVVSEKLSPHLIEGGVYFVDDLPTTATGKLKRPEITRQITPLYFARKNSRAGLAS